MNVEELRKELQQAQIPKHYYNLDEMGRDDERLCLQKHLDKWNVYYSERGNKTTNLFFDSEEEACQYIYTQLCV